MARKSGPGSARPEPTLSNVYMESVAIVRVMLRPNSMTKPAVAQASSRKSLRETHNRTTIREQ